LLTTAQQCTSGSHSLKFVTISTWMDTLKYSFFPRTITDWNQLDANIVLAHQSVPSRTGSENNDICLRPIQHLCLHNAVAEHLCQSWITNWDMQHTDKDCKYVTNMHPFNGHLSGTTRMSRYQKGKTNLDFTEARVAVASAGPYASLHLVPDR